MRQCLRFLLLRSDTGQKQLGGEGLAHIPVWTPSLQDSYKDLGTVLAS